MLASVSYLALVSCTISLLKAENNRQLLSTAANGAVYRYTASLVNPLVSKLTKPVNHILVFIFIYLFPVFLNCALLASYFLGSFQ